MCPTTRPALEEGRTYQRCSWTSAGRSYDKTLREQGHKLLEEGQETVDLDTASEIETSGIGRNGNETNDTMTTRTNITTEDHHDDGTGDEVAVSYCEVSHMFQSGSVPMTADCTQACCGTKWYGKVLGLLVN